MKTFKPGHALPTQTHELRQIWDDLFCLQPRLRATLPADLTRARARLGQLSGQSDEARPFENQHLFVFYRIATLLERRAQPLTMHELGEELDIPLSTATRVVDWLVEGGYVERHSDLQDRRIVRVALTDSGSQLYAAFNEFFNQRVEEFLRRFTPEERQTLLALLHKTVEVLNTFPI
ncbi:MAG: MarR family transcriptional regulator [Anaerolineae bacterium]